MHWAHAMGSRLHTVKAQIMVSSGPGICADPVLQQFIAVHACRMMLPRTHSTYSEVGMQGH